MMMMELEQNQFKKIKKFNIFQKAFFAYLEIV